MNWWDINAPDYYLMKSPCLTCENKDMDKSLCLDDCQLIKLFQEAYNTNREPESVRPRMKQILKNWGRINTFLE